MCRLSSLKGQEHRLPKRTAREKGIILGLDARYQGLDMVNTRCESSKPSRMVYCVDGCDAELIVPPDQRVRLCIKYTGKVNQDASHNRIPICSIRA